MYEDERGVFPETQFVFDLDMPESFQPVNIDGEVEAFYLLTIEEVSFSPFYLRCLTPSASVISNTVTILSARTLMKRKRAAKAGVTF